MPDTNDDLPTQSEAISSEEAPERQVSRTPAQVKSPGLSRWLAPIALILALVACGLAGWALAGKNASSQSGPALAGDPKTRVCTAFTTVSQAVPLQTNNDLGPDPVAQAAVGANARLALFGGGQSLLNSLDSETPDELAQKVRSFGNALEEISMNALAGQPNSDPAQAARLAEADATRLQIVELCK